MIKLLVTGQMRSGTTFLCNFLNSQKNAVVYADFIRTPFTMGEKLKIRDAKTSLTEQQKNILFSNLIAEGLSIGFDFPKHMDRKACNTWEDFIDQSFGALAKLDGNPNAKVAGIKKTEETLYLKALLDANCKIIYMIRDARDVLVSSKNRFAHYKLFPFFRRWEDNLAFASQFAGHKNFMLLRYEDLMLNTETSLMMLEAFLGIKLVVNEGQKLKSRSYEGTYNDNSSFGDISKLFDAKGVNRWKSQLESEEVLLVSTFAKKTLEKYDYEIPSDLPNKGKQQQLMFKYRLYKLYKRFTGIIRARL